MVDVFTKGMTLPILAKGEKKTPTPKGFYPGNNYHLLSAKNSQTRARNHDRRFFTAAVMDQLRKTYKVDEGGNKQTYMVAISRRLVKIAATSPEREALRAIQEIFDRVEGKPVQAIELSGPDKRPVEMITKEMTDADAARIFQRMLRGD